MLNYSKGSSLPHMTLLEAFVSDDFLPFLLKLSDFSDTFVVNERQLFLGEVKAG
jgi:hypothetical protein